MRPASVLPSLNRTVTPSGLSVNDTTSLPNFKAPAASPPIPAPTISAVWESWVVIATLNLL
jgi:hypothetical protein